MNPGPNQPPNQNTPSEHSYGGYGAYVGGAAYGGNYGPYAYARSAESPTQVFKEYASVLWRKKWLILTIFIVCSVAWTQWTLRQTPFYRAAAVLQVDVPFKVIDLNRVSGGGGNSIEAMNTMIRVIGGRDMGGRVARTLTLETRDDFIKGLVEPGKGPVRDKVGLMLSCLKVEGVRNSNLINIVVEHPNPNFAADVANAFAQHFIRYNAERAATVSYAAVKWLQDQVDDLKIRTEASERKLLEYREKNDADALDDRQNIITDNLRAQNQRVNESKDEVLAADKLWAEIEPIQNNREAMLNNLTISSFPEVKANKDMLSQMEFQYINLQKKYRAKHPQMMAAQTQLEKVNKDLDMAIRLAAVVIKERVVRSKANLEQQTAKLSELTSEQKNLDRLKVEYNTYQRENAINRGLLDSMTTQLKNTQITTTLNDQNITILEPAGIPGRPFKPDRAKNISFGMLMGLGLGVGMAYTLYFLDDKIKNQFDIESYLQLPMIGVIPKIRRQSKKSLDMMALEDKSSIGAEAIRAVRVALKLRTDADNLRCIMTTSTIPSEGKSFISSNLSISFAQTGLKTLLIDADLRRPSVHSGFRILNNSGLGNILAGQCQWRDTLQECKVPGLHVITAGTNRTDPHELLSQPLVGELINEMLQEYDRVIVDSTPLTAVSDALTLVPFVHGIIYVVKSGTVRRGLVSNCIQRLVDVSAPIIGVVLNQVTKADAQGYYYTQKYYSQYVSR
ncbi:MAG: polysaccharide biosynthesis tyrosine autokinase [Verrucomicrobiae bacterium]|nr:polysaccharide biosynthesis tyrosine autokinase [Verrucomicrobiae bacterium]